MIYKISDRLHGLVSGLIVFNHFFCAIKRLSVQAVYLFFASLILIPIGSDDFVLSAVLAEANDQTINKRIRKRKVATVRERHYKKIAKIEKLINESNQEQALLLLEDLARNDSLNQFELAQTWSYLAYLYASNDEFDKALAAYENILEFRDRIPLVLELRTLFNRAQIFTILEQYDSVIFNLNEYISLAGPNVEVYEYLARAYYELEKYSQAAVNASLAVEMEKNDDDLENPKESLYLILRSAYYELNQFAEVQEVMEELVLLYPKGEYFVQLANIYGERGREFDQLALYQFAYDSGMLSKGSDLINLAVLLLDYGVPYSAAKIVKRGLNANRIEHTVSNFKLLAQAWYLAHRPLNMIEALNSAVNIESDQNAELYYELALAYSYIEEWPMVVESIDKGAEFGFGKKQGVAHNAKAFALFNMQKLELSVSEFTKAFSYSNAKLYAQKMVQYIKGIMEKKKRIEESFSMVAF